MPRFLFRPLLLLLPLLALAGCCGNATCNCRDSLADSLFFAFDPTFTATELDTVYVARYNNAAITAAQPLDALPLPLATRAPTNLAGQIDFQQQSQNGLVVIGNTAPFSQSSVANSNLSAFTYILRVQRDGSRTRFYSYKVDQIVLRGGYVGDGCCSCYRNNYKQVRVSRLDDANTITSFLPVGDVTDANSGGSPRTPRVIVLPK